MHPCHIDDIILCKDNLSSVNPSVKRQSITSPPGQKCQNWDENVMREIKFTPHSKNCEFLMFKQSCDDVT